MNMTYKIQNFFRAVLFIVALLLFMTKTSFAQTSPSEDEISSEVVVQKNKSIMFDEKDIEYIDNALKSFEKEIDLEILLPELFPTDDTIEIVEEDIEIIEEEDTEEILEEEVAEEEVIDVIVEEVEEIDVVKNYYLKSLLYYSPDDWVVWLNDEKISKDSKADLVKILKIDQTSVNIIIEDVDLSLYSSDWKEELYKISGTDYFTDKKSIIFDSGRKLLSFVLKTNQTFIGETLEIVEGRYSESVSYDSFSDESDERVGRI